MLVGGTSGQDRGSRGVAPVVSVVLVVAVAVILSAIVATLALDITEQTNNPAPNAVFDAQIDNDTGTVTITHISGERIDPASLLVDGAVINEGQAFEGDAVQAGDSAEVRVGLGDEISLVWDDAESEATALFDTYDVSDVIAFEDNFTVSISGTRSFRCNGTLYGFKVRGISGDSVSGITRTSSGGGRYYTWDGREVGDRVFEGYDPFVIIAEIDNKNNEVTFARPIKRVCR